MTTLTTQDIERKLQTIIKEVCCQDGSTPALDQTLGGIGADSLDYVEIILGCEMVFGIDIEQDSWEKRVNHNTTTIEQMAAYVGELVKVEEWK